MGISDADRHRYAQFFCVIGGEQGAKPYGRPSHGRECAAGPLDPVKVAEPAEPGHTSHTTVLKMHESRGVEKTHAIFQQLIEKVWPGRLPRQQGLCYTAL
jgi:hypothetical protein